MRTTKSCGGWSGMIVAVALVASVAVGAPPTTGLQAWYKADTGVTTDGSGNVSQWNDQSGYNNHATQGTANLRPALSSALMPVGASMSVVQYHNNNTDGSYDKLLLPNIAQDGGSGSTVYFVVNDDADTTRSSLNWLNRVVAASPAIYGRASSSTKVGYYYSSAWRAEATPTPSGWKVGRFMWNGSGASTLVTNYVTKAGASASTATAPATTSQWASIGYEGSGQQTYSSFAEILIYNRALDSTEQGQVETYLQERYFGVPAPGTTYGDVTWSGGAGAGDPSWSVTNNWLGNEAPVTSSAATVFFKTNGQAVVGVLETNRQVGKISVGDGSTTISHTLNLGGRTLTLAGDVMTPSGARATLTVTNGTLRVGTATRAGNIEFGNYTCTLKVSPGATLDPANVNTLRLGYTGWGDAGQGLLDLRGAQVASGVLAVSNLYLRTGAYVYSHLYLDSATSLSNIQVRKALEINNTSGPGTGYIGNPSDSGRLPPNISVRVGSSPSNRGSIEISRVSFVGYGGVDGKLVASGGGTFEAYLTEMHIVRYEAGDAGGANRTANPHIGTLDISTMNSCLIDVNTLKIAPDHYIHPPLSVDNLQGTLALCPGVVTAGTVVVGTTLGSGWGRLSMSNTMFTVTNSFTLNKNAQVTIKLGGEPKGLDIAGTFADPSTGTITVHFVSAPTVGTNWAIRMKGDAQTALNTMIGAGRLTSSGTYAGKKVGVLYDAGVGYTYYAMADSNAFSTLPIAIAYDERTYEVAAGSPVTIGTNDINNGSSDPDSRPLTLTISTNGGPESATLTFDAVGDYPVTLKVTAGSDFATDTCTVHVVALNPGVTNALTWNGAASTPLMDRRAWMWSANWVQGAPPTNPTAATVYFQELGQTVTSVLETNRVVGGLDVGDSGATVNHALDLGGSTLTVARLCQNWRSNVAVSNGTLRLGTDTEQAAFHAGASADSTWTFRAGTLLDTHNAGRFDVASGNWGAGGSGVLNLEQAGVAGGTLRAGSMALGVKDSTYARLLVPASLQELAVTGSLKVAWSWGGGSAYIGQSATEMFPTGMNLTVGMAPATRGELIVAQQYVYNRNTTGKLIASSGGAFRGCLGRLGVALMSSDSERGATRTTTGILDLSAMTNCTVDAREVLVACDHLTLAANANDDFRGTLRLPPGTVQVSDAIVGATTNTGVGVLELSNTVFAVTNRIELRKTARVTVNVGAQSSGLVISNAADTAFSMDTATNGALRIVFKAKAAASPFYGLAWAGDHEAALESLQADGRLVIDSSGLAPKTASVFKESGVTYVGLASPGGTSFVFR